LGGGKVREGLYSVKRGATWTTLSNLEEKSKNFNVGPWGGKKSLKIRPREDKEIFVSWEKGG